MVICRLLMVAVTLVASKVTFLHPWSMMWLTETSDLLRPGMILTCRAFAGSLGRSNSATWVDVRRFASGSSTSMGLGSRLMAFNLGLGGLKLLVAPLSMKVELDKGIRETGDNCCEVTFVSLLTRVSRDCQALVRSPRFDPPIRLVAVASC